MNKIAILFCGRFQVRGHIERKLSVLPHLAFEDDFSLMGIRDGLGYRKPETVASRVAVAGRIHAVEAVENLFLVLRGDAATVTTSYQG